jgi:hypothetical protein
MLVAAALGAASFPPLGLWPFALASICLLLYKAKDIHLCVCVWPGSRSEQFAAQYEALKLSTTRSYRRANDGPRIYTVGVASGLNERGGRNECARRA